jgi:hypothetical protein
MAIADGDYVNSRLVCRVSVQYAGSLFDTGGDRIVHVDVDHHSISFLYHEAVKKTIPISDVEAVYANKRQAMQLVLVEADGDSSHKVCGPASK